MHSSRESLPRRNAVPLGPTDLPAARGFPLPKALCHWLHKRNGRSGPSGCRRRALSRHRAFPRRFFVLNSGVNIWWCTRRMACTPAQPARCAARAGLGRYRLGQPKVRSPEALPRAVCWIKPIHALRSWRTYCNGPARLAKAKTRTPGTPAAKPAESRNHD